MPDITGIVTVTKQGTVTGVETHPNAPVIINFYRIKRGKKVYNRRAKLLQFTNELNVAANIGWYNRMFNDFGRRTYYRAN